MKRIKHIAGASVPNRLLCRRHYKICFSIAFGHHDRAFNKQSEKQTLQQRASEAALAAGPVVGSAEALKAKRFVWMPKDSKGAPDLRHVETIVQTYGCMMRVDFWMNTQKISLHSIKNAADRRACTIAGYNPGTGQKQLEKRVMFKNLINADHSQLVDMVMLTCDGKDVNERYEAAFDRCYRKGVDMVRLYHIWEKMRQQTGRGTLSDPHRTA